MSKAQVPGDGSYKTLLTRLGLDLSQSAPVLSIYLDESHLGMLVHHDPEPYRANPLAAVDLFTLERSDSIPL